MAHDIFESLTTADVPPMPESFDRDVHRRVNNVLSGLHLLEFFTKAAAYAVAYFARAFWGAAVLTLSGRQIGDRPRSP
jgi:hypothetical protein